MKIKLEENPILIDVGGSKQPHDLLPPKYHYEVLDVTGKVHKFTNIDLNLCKPFPIESNTIDGYYTSMLLEHLHVKATIYTFAEMYRTLKPGGMIRTVVPDIDKAIKWYMNDPNMLKSTEMPSMPEHYPPTNLGLLLSWFISPPPIKASGRSGHQNAFNRETMTWYMDKAGFINVKQKSFNDCHEYYIGKDIPRYKSWALYMEANKK